LIETDAGQRLWAGRLAPILQEIVPLAEGETR
jgi:hypothetical protein